MGSPSQIRADVEGLRAIAVLMVLFYHSGMEIFSGGFSGVDIFFVISGFLITQQLARELEQHNTISIIDFYARRARRLLPAATTVLLFTAFLAWIYLPATSWCNLSIDIAGSSLYIQNWVLADRSVDYLAQGSGISPLLHFWSLSIEEQFYLAWPLIIMSCILFAKRYLISTTALLKWVILLILASSAVNSIIVSYTYPDHGYFATTCRVWEIAIGALIALNTDWLRRHLPEGYSVYLSSTGILAILLSCFMINAQTPWPGFATLFPTLGTAFIIVAGTYQKETTVTRILGARPMRWFGGLSYGIYLWHWPLIFFTNQLGSRGLIINLLIFLASIILAITTFHLIENPIRHNRYLASHRGTALSLGACCMMLSTGAALALSSQVPQTPSPPKDAPGAAILVDPATKNGDRPAIITNPERFFSKSGIFYPAPSSATTDVPPVYTTGCQADEKTTSPRHDCVFGARNGSVRVALVGDSVAAQWLSAFETIAKLENWRLELFAKGACSFTSDVPPFYKGGLYESCGEWNRNILKIMTDPATRPDIVIHSQNRSLSDLAPNGGNPLADNYQALVSAGIKVVAIKDNPAPSGGTIWNPEASYTCLERYPEDFQACWYRANDGVGTKGITSAIKLVPEVMLLDLNAWICPPSVRKCPLVIGERLIFRQGSHLTKSYVDSLAPVIHRKLRSLGIAKSHPLEWP